MRKTFPESGALKNLIIIVAVLTILASVKDASAQYPFSGAQEKSSQFDFSVRVIDRTDEGNTTPILFDAGTPILIAEDAFDVNMSVGAELSYIFPGQSGDADYEIRGFFNQWDNLVSITGTGLTSPFIPTIPGGTINSFGYTYDSEMFSIELNRRTDVFQGFSGYAGIRYMSLSETFNFSSSGSVPGPLPPITTFPFTLTNTTTTENPMLGLQVGGDGSYSLTQGMHLDFKGNIAFLSNWASRATLAGSSFGGSTTTNASQNDGTIVGELGMQLHYDIVPDQISAFLGYEGMYITGVAVAPTQLVLAGGIDDDQIMFLNGFNVGIKVIR